MRREQKYHAEFEKALSLIQRRAGMAFRDIHCPHTRADLLQEVQALAWKWWLRLRQRKCNPNLFVGVLATYAVRAVRSGRRLCGQERSQEVLSFLARRKHGFGLERLPQSTRGNYDQLYARPGGQRLHDALEEGLRDNTQTPVPEQAAFRCDFPVWLSSWDGRNRRIVERMMAGERTQALAAQFGLTPARISQLRRKFRLSWILFLGEV